MAVPDPPAPKHFGVGDRRRRFDPKSRYGGRGGHSLVAARPRADVARCVAGYGDTCVCAEHAAANSDGAVGQGQGLMLDSIFTPGCWSFLPCGQPRSSHALRCRCGGRAFQVAALLEEACSQKTTWRDPDCPDVVVSEYRMEEPDAEPAVYRVSSAAAATNRRRVAIGFDVCHLGCSKCGKKGQCARLLAPTKVRRRRARAVLAGAVSDAVKCHGYGEGEGSADSEEAFLEPETESEDDGPPGAAAAARSSPASPASTRGSSVLADSGSWLLVESGVLCLEDSDGCSSA